MSDREEALVGCLLAFFLAVFVVVAVSVLYTVPIMLLWNWLMPELFGLTTITFWQALGLSTLTSLLFKSTPSSNTSKK